MFDELNKFEVAEKIERLIEVIHEPGMSRLPKELYEEIVNMPRDKEGGIPKYYLSDSLKVFIAAFDDVLK
ncbi:hypothetical protein [Pseudogracilibacillus auburnensis]|uniref:hypothetical protein n=1 Tax=Pseudogracilibacillus auburnensis TaxID=1494959 RepID=UPI001A97A793|nr:hypothetical protein [Pseudogracilibacillus auburnensis]MBO1003753.1 hypothetical protein [Pseudogracilibacillus auburnensis]